MKETFNEESIIKDKARSETGKCAKPHNSHEMRTFVTEMNGQSKN